MRKAEASFARGEYYDAATHYRKAYNRISAKERNKRGEVAFKMGGCYRCINYTVRAKTAYMNAIRYKYPDSTAYFYLAEMLRKNGEYKTAVKEYQAYLEYNPNDLLARNGLLSCELSTNWKATPTRYAVKRMAAFNTRRSEYSPMYTPDDANTIYFTSTGTDAKGEKINGITGLKSADIFFSRRNEKGQWQKPTPIKSEVNSLYEDGVCSFSPDGKTMYFTRCRTSPDRDMVSEIYQSQRISAEWGMPQVYKVVRDSLSSVAHPAVSPEGEYIYFVSDMPGGYGGKDLWRVDINEDEENRLAENLGSAINTPGNEMFPSFDPEGMLYFSSDGHPGMGGLDIFKAIQTVKGEWKIENLRSPVNSNADDFSMTFEPGNPNKGFFSSNRGDARGWDHIYSFELPEIIYNLTGWVFDREGDALPEAIVTFVGDDGTYQKLDVRGDGSFQRRVEPGRNYILLATCPDYLNYKQELVTDTVQENMNYELEFPLASITRPVMIENIYYEFDSAELTAESTVALDELIQLLTDNPNAVIELSAHCDYRGNDEYNQRLSQRRAESVVRYLTGGGINRDRLVARGYGESRPKMVTPFIIRSAPFLKEGDILTEEFILTLSEEEQEICNALNRRTEFKVVRTTVTLSLSKGLQQSNNYR